MRTLYSIASFSLLVVFNASAAASTIKSVLTKQKKYLSSGVLPLAKQNFQNRWYRSPLLAVH